MKMSNCRLICYAGIHTDKPQEFDLHMGTCIAKDNKQKVLKYKINEDRERCK
jgi:hypothetical protein